MCYVQQQLQNATLIVIYHVMMASETGAVQEQEATSSKAGNNDEVNLMSRLRDNIRCGRNK
jgi:hypothetical protein